MPAEIYSVTDYAYVNINIKLLDIYMKYDRILLDTQRNFYSFTYVNIYYVN
jgi:hypothetical protein